MLLLDNALRYANNVISGIEVTTWEVKKQCEIFLDDYNNNQHKDDFDFYLDKKQLKVISNLLKLMNFATGFVAGKQVLSNLADFQCFFLANIFGWRYKNNPKKFRYNDNTLYIARKNAKTALIGIVFILLLLTEQNYSEFYSICLTKELAAEIKKIMEQIINASPLIKQHFKVSSPKCGRITCKITNSFFEPRVAEAGKNNSVRPCCVLHDECANFKENSNFNAMKSGQKNVLNPLVFRTTTAYAINGSIFEEDLEYIRKVLNGVIDNKRQFALIYYADKENLWNDTGILQANPLRLEENYNTMREDRAIAQEKTSAKTEYLTKTMNVFVQENEDNKYIDINYWKKCRVDKIDFKNKHVIVGVDLSITTDLTAVAIGYVENDIFYYMSTGFLPRGSLSKRQEKIDYLTMERQGYCIINDGETVDYNIIEEYIRNIENKYECIIDCIVTDPYNALNMMQNLANDYDVLFLKQTYTNLSPATKDFRKQVYDNKIRYQANSLLDWNVSNAITTKGKSDDEMLAKQSKNKQRIDMLAVLIFIHTQIFIKEQEKYNPLMALDNANW